MPNLLRQILAFVGVGLLAAVVHYGLLIGLVEGFGFGPVPSTLVGYVGGGVVSYLLNRTHVFESQRAHDEAWWRFAFVAAMGFGFTWMFMHLFVERWHAPYLPAQVITTGLVMIWSFLANRMWTFRK
jgi:putative flippase GtrA